MCLSRDTSPARTQLSSPRPRCFAPLAFNHVFRCLSLLSVPTRHALAIDPWSPHHLSRPGCSHIAGRFACSSLPIANPSLMFRFRPPASRSRIHLPPAPRRCRAPMRAHAFPHAVLRILLTVNVMRVITRRFRPLYPLTYLADPRSRIVSRCGALPLRRASMSGHTTRHMPPSPSRPQPHSATVLDRRHCSPCFVRTHTVFQTHCRSVANARALPNYRRLLAAFASTFISRLLSCASRTSLHLPLATLSSYFLHLRCLPRFMISVPRFFRAVRRCATRSIDASRSSMSTSNPSGCSPKPLGNTWSPAGAGRSSTSALCSPSRYARILFRTAVSPQLTVGRSPLRRSRTINLFYLAAFPPPAPPFRRAFAAF